jgi:hypothetical protein
MAISKQFALECVLIEVKVAIDAINFLLSISHSDAKAGISKALSKRQKQLLYASASSVVTELATLATSLQGTD